jgi:hypothetical protein
MANQRKAEEARRRIAKGLMADAQKLRQYVAAPRPNHSSDCGFSYLPTRRPTAEQKA